jgi:heat shock protein 1/8
MGGMDFAGSINQLRFNMQVQPIFRAVSAKVRKLVERANLDLYEVDQVVYVGGSASLQSLDEELASLLSENVTSPFKAGTVVCGGIGDPTTILRGSAVQGSFLASLSSTDDKFLSSIAVNGLR